MDLMIPFHIRDDDGEVRVSYEVNEDPARWGDLLLGFNELPDPGKGFPVCSASVAFEGEGYNTAMGWIQILRFTGQEEGVLVDQPPQLAGVDMPYLSFGPTPSFFDNPFTDQHGMHWIAETFLVISPDAVMTRVVQPVCGFSWGYSTEGERTAALPLAQVDEARWLAACEVLRERYPSWTFLETWATA